MPKFDVNKLIKFRNTYKRYTKVSAQIGSLSISQEAANMNMSTEKYIDYKLNELLDSEKDFSNQKLANKIAAQTSEGVIKDNSLIQISDDDDKKMERAAEAVGLCYAMEEAIGKSLDVEKNTQIYNKMVADVKKIYNISDEQFLGFKQVIHNVSLETKTYKDHALGEDGSFTSQVEKAPIESVAQKKAKQLAERQLNGEISFETDIIFSNEESAQNRIVNDIKANLKFGFIIGEQDIRNADYYYKQAFQEPVQNGVIANQDGTYDKNCYFKYFDDALAHEEKKNKDEIDETSKEMAEYVKKNIKGEVKDDTTVFTMHMEKDVKQARANIVNSQQNMFSIKLGKYFVAKQCWQNKGILDIIAHPFKAYDQYKEMQGMKADFMREYNIDSEEMQKIDNFQNKNKLPKEIPANYKIGARLDTGEINKLEFRYDEKKYKIETSDERINNSWREKDRMISLASKTDYEVKNMNDFHLSEKSVEKQIEEKTNELKDQFNKKFNLNEKIKNDPEKKKEIGKDIGAK